MAGPPVPPIFALALRPLGVHDTMPKNVKDPTVNETDDEDEAKKVLLLPLELDDCMD